MKLTSYLKRSSILMLAISASTFAWKDKVKAVGYLMEWRGSPSQERVDGLSHLIITGFKLDAVALDGTLDTTKHVDNTKIKNLVAMGAAGDTKIMMMLGGWGSDAGFSEAAATPAARQKLATQLANYCVGNGLAGVDFDWEFPANNEFQNYEEMMKVTREEFDKHGLLLTSAIGQSHHSKFTQGTWQYLDFVNVMAYDMNWASSGSNMRDNHSPAEMHIEYYPIWENAGVPKEKIVMGMPFYARQTNDWGVAKGYSEIFNSYSPLASDNIAGGFNFNGPNTIYNKSAFSAANGYGGVMIWEIEHDLEAGHESGLQTAMLKGIADGLAGTDVVKEVTSDVKMGGTSSSSNTSSSSSSTGNLPEVIDEMAVAGKNNIGGIWYALGDYWDRTDAQKADGEYTKVWAPDGVTEMANGEGTWGDITAGYTTKSTYDEVLQAEIEIAHTNGDVMNYGALQMEFVARDCSKAAENECWKVDETGGTVDLSASTSVDVILTCTQGEEIQVGLVPLSNRQSFYGQKMTCSGSEETVVLDLKSMKDVETESVVLDLKDVYALKLKYASLEVSSVELEVSKVSLVGGTTAVLAQSLGQNFITIQGSMIVNSSDNLGQYLITNLKGNVILSGTLESHQALDLSSKLSSGSFYLVSHSQGQRSVSKINFLND